MKINKPQSTPAVNDTGVQVDCLLSATVDNEDNMEIVILCLTGQVVIKAQMWAELLFQFLSVIWGPPQEAQQTQWVVLYAQFSIQLSFF